MTKRAHLSDSASTGRSLFLSSRVTWYLVGVFLAVPIIVLVLTTRYQAIGPFSFVVEMSASVPSTAQLFFDRGEGFSESESVIVNTVASPKPISLRFPLRAGRYSQLRFDPGKSGGTFQIHGLYILDPEGRTVVRFALDQVAPRDQIASIDQQDGRLVVEVAEGSDDPQLRIELDGPLVLSNLTLGLLLEFALIALAIAVASIALVAVVGKAARRFLWLVSALKSEDNRGATAGFLNMRRLPLICDLLIAIPFLLGVVAMRYIVGAGDIINDGYNVLLSGLHVLRGEVPGVDYVAMPYEALSYWAAFELNVSDLSPSFDFLMSAVFMGLGCVATYLAARILGLRRAYAVYSALFVILLYPRLYNYFKILPLGVLTLAIAYYLRAPSGGRAAIMGLVTTFCLFVRLDLGLLAALSSGLAILLSSAIPLAGC